MNSVDPAMVLYFCIGALGPLVAAQPPASWWDGVKLAAGCLLSGFTAVKGYTEISRTSRQAIAAARVEGATGLTQPQPVLAGEPTAPSQRNHPVIPESWP